MLMNPFDTVCVSQSSKSLQLIDDIVVDWLQNLTKENWRKIKRNKSLYGIKLPDKWIKVWRIILKNPDLRDSEKATNQGTSIGTYTHIWNIWAEECIEKYLSDMEKELLFMVDAGFLYSEIGDAMLLKYGDDFWKPRKVNTKTTPSQVVNNYLYWKMPNKIARSELTDLVLRAFKKE